MILRKLHFLFTGILLLNLVSCSQLKNQTQSKNETEIVADSLACPLNQSTFTPTDSDDFELTFQNPSTDNGIDASVDLNRQGKGMEFRFGFLRQEPDLYDWALVASGIPGPASDITATPTFPVYAYDAQMHPTRSDEQVKYIFVEGLGDFYSQIADTNSPGFSINALRGKVWIKKCRSNSTASSETTKEKDVDSDTVGLQAKPDASLANVEKHCLEVAEATKVCDSNLVLEITNNTVEPQKYLLVKAEITNSQGNKLTGVECFPKEDLVILENPITTGESIIVTSHHRKYYEYSYAEIEATQWIKSPAEYYTAFERVENVCP